MLIRITICALALLLATPAYAEPITAALLGAAFVAAHPLIASVVTFFITTAISLGIGLLKNALFGNKQAEQQDQPIGVKFDVQVGDQSPVAFLVGSYATAGTRKYIGTWGSDGKTPNAFLTDVLQVGDLPAPGQPGLWVNGQKCTVLWNETPVEQGYPVSEFRVGGKDHLWVKYRDGTATAADSFLLSKFGGLSDRPWQSDMIGRGTPICIVTALVNRELFPGQMRYLFEPPVQRWYDLRKDSTAGGSGSHRWSDWSTWEVTGNPVVIAYNIIRGVYYGVPGAGEWVFGGQNLPAFRLPASAWMAAMNECDRQVSLSGGGTEAQFRCGYEVSGDMEPLAVVAELMKSCSGRIAEVGGIFKPIVGVPSAAVYSFTDGDIVVTREQGYKPFPPLDDTYNGIEATYPEPAEAWATKDAPARYSSTLEAADGNRRLVAGVNFPAVPYAGQAQRLMAAMIEEERRFRVHQFFLPPDAWLLEPNDVVAWTSARNGYENKKFLIVEIVGERTLNQGVLLKEIDPSDYDPDPDTILPVTVGPLGPIRAPAQAIVDWFAEGVTESINGKQRACIRLSWDGDQDDVARVIWEVRRVDTLAMVHTGGTDSVTAGEALISQNLFSDEDYQVRGRYLPFTARQTIWSDWIAVHTPNSPMTDIAIALASLAADAKAMLARLSRMRTDFLEMVEQVARDAALGAGSNAQRIAVAQKNGNALAASFIDFKAEVTEDFEATAELIAGVAASVNELAADGLLRFAASADPLGGAEAQVDMMVRASDGGVFSSAGLSARVTSGGDSDLLLFADRIFFTDGTATYTPVVIQSGQLILKGARMEVADIGTVTTGKIQSTDGKFIIDATNQRIVMSE